MSTNTHVVHGVGTATVNAASIPTIESVRSIVKQIAAVRLDAGACPGRMPNRRLTNEFGSSPAIKPNPAQAPSAAYPAGVNCHNVAGGTPRGRETTIATAANAERRSRDHDDKAPQRLVLTEDWPSAKRAAAIKRNRQDLRDATTQPQRLQEAGKHEGHN